MTYSELLDWLTDLGDLADSEGFRDFALVLRMTAHAIRQNEAHFARRVDPPPSEETAALDQAPPAPLS